MNARSKWTATLVVGAILVLGVGGPTLAQTQTRQAIDVQRILDELGLTGDLRAELAGRLDSLNARLAEPGGASTYCYGNWDLFSGLSDQLTDDQWTTLREELGNSGALGFMGHGGGFGMHGMGAGGGQSGHMGGTMGGMAGHGHGGHMQGMSGGGRGMGSMHGTGMRSGGAIGR